MHLSFCALHQRANLKLNRGLTGGDKINHIKTKDIKSSNDL